jgi:heat-inducible transcriptional repressor
MQTRQQEIFNLIVEEYIRTAEPVGSQVLVRKCKLNFSPATARNEMAELEEAGYLFQPHTSAGRVPTDKGYRFYVDSAVFGNAQQTRSEKMESRLKKTADAFQGVDSHRFIKEISKMISEFSRNVGLCGFLEEDEFYSAGLSNLLREPEFEGNPGSINSLEIFDYLDQEMKKVFTKMEKDIEVFIGKENKNKKFSDFSLVISKCRASGGKSGVIGVLGPKRMDYTRNIALVDLMRELITNNR